MSRCLRHSGRILRCSDGACFDDVRLELHHVLLSVGLGCLNDLRQSLEVVFALLEQGYYLILYLALLRFICHVERADRSFQLRFLFDFDLLHVLEHFVVGLRGLVSQVTRCFVLFALDFLAHSLQHLRHFLHVLFNLALRLLVLEQRVLHPLVHFCQVCRQFLRHVLFEVAFEAVDLLLQFLLDFSLLYLEAHYLLLEGRFEALRPSFDLSSGVVARLVDLVDAGLKHFGVIFDSLLLDLYYCVLQVVDPSPQFVESIFHSGLESVDRVARPLSILQVLELFLQIEELFFELVIQFLCLLGGHADQIVFHALSLISEHIEHGFLQLVPHYQLLRVHSLLEFRQMHLVVVCAQFILKAVVELLPRD